jgi:hypothetical protein
VIIGTTVAKAELEHIARNAGDQLRRTIEARTLRLEAADKGVETAQCLFAASS